jgi:hypothetical protein
MKRTGFLGLRTFAPLLVACGTASPVESPADALVPLDGLPAADELCPIGNSIVASSGGIKLALGASRASGVAPFAVFFDTSGTIATSTERPFHELDYRWSFGDPSSGTWSNGAKAGSARRNIATGPLAAHVFESAGTYPISVSAFNGSTTVAYSCNIVVTSGDTEFAGSKTVCVSATGNFTDCPLGATHVTSASPAVAVANSIGEGNKRILFARGETFDVASTIVVNQPGPGHFGAFGNGAKPAFVNTAELPTFSMSTITSPTIADWRVTDIQIDGGGFVAATGIEGSGAINNVLVSRVDIKNVKNGVHVSGSTLDAQKDAGIAATMWDGVFVFDSTVDDLVGTGATGGNAIYMTGWRVAVVGNNVDNHFHGEHGMRSAYTDRSVWQHNSISGIAAGRAFMTLRSPNQGGSVLAAQLPGIVYTQKLIASDNYMQGSAVASGFAGTGPTNQSSSGRAREQIWERNLLIGGTGTSGYFGFAGYQITARNNILIMPAGSASMAFAGQPLDVSPNPTDIWIYNNSIFYGGPERFQLLVLIGGSMAGSQYTIQNNLWYAPNSAPGEQINNIAGASVTTCPSCNTSEAEVAVSPRFTANPPTTAAGFTLLPQSYAVGRGVAVPVWSDFFGDLPQPAADLQTIGAARQP